MMGDLATLCMRRRSRAEMRYCRASHQYTADMTAMTPSATGVVMPMTTAVAVSWNSSCARLEMLTRTVSSTVLTSLRKRFKMRPAGLVEKKRAGAASTERRAALCSTVLARRAPAVRVIMRTSATAACAPLRYAYTAM
jgi:hypothetical protein